VGVNFSGIMAGSQRINNLFNPLLQKDNLCISNLIINVTVQNKISNKILVKALKYKLINPFSVIFYLFNSVLFSYKKYDKNSLNIIYHYGYPSIEDIAFLKISKLIGYKVVFDIVEIIKYFDQSKSSKRMRFKNYTSRLLLNQLYKIGSMCFAISTDLFAFCKALCKNQIPVIHLPISVDVEFVNSFKRENSNGNIKIFYGGSFGLKDGINYLIRGFELACDANSEIELLLTGKICKEMDGVLQELISNSKWISRIKYLGCLSVSKYFETMVNSDILCMTRVNTTYANAGFPFKLGEYLASGNAIIATDVGDVSKYLKNKHNAILIKPGSAIDICDAILMLCQDKERRIKIGSSGKGTALKYFSADLVSNILWENISKLGNVQNGKIFPRSFIKNNR
jgi:glycosyltransferase involved in cell wall biosynthesis